MQATSQAPPMPGGSFQVLPCGFDCGNGSVKLALESSETRIPSYVRPVYGDLDSSSEYYRDGLVEYLSGDRTDLIGSKWFAGEHAYLTAPGMQANVVDDKQGKLVYGLQLLLGAIAELPHRPYWQLALAGSIQDAESLRGELAQKLKGTHTVKLNGKHTSVVGVAVLGITEEGIGAISQGHTFGLVAASSQTIVLDVGHGTIIASLFAPKGKLIARDVQWNGAEKLIDAIARNIATRKQLMAEGDRTVIRKGIENANFNYGSTGWNFNEIYKTELMGWAKAVIAPALKAMEPWRATSDAAIAIGGGVNLPGIAQLLTAKGITAYPDPSWANARGLLRLAQAKRRGN
jgi:Actin like proteins N terminal domain